MSRKSFKPIRQQQGITLVVALIFLVILTLIGITMAQNTTLEEHMAGNTRDRDIAFQAAEYALKEAEKAINDNCTKGTALPSMEAYATSNDESYWRNFDWSGSANAHAVATGPGDAKSKPKYVIQQIYAAGKATTYRATARGTGGTDNAMAIVQAAFTCTTP